jgi:hypothetical protein
VLANMIVGGKGGDRALIEHATEIGKAAPKSGTASAFDPFTLL